MTLAPADPADPDPVIAVDIDNRQQTHGVDTQRYADLLAATLRSQYPLAAGADSSDPVAEVGLAFIGVAEMTELNEAHMQGSGPTDVLAFPIDGVADSGVVPPGQITMFGDIVICTQVAAQAPQSLDDELALLVVHGALHLIGHDHGEPDETAVMKALEVAMLDQHYHGGGAA